MPQYSPDQPRANALRTSLRQEKQYNGVPNRQSSGSRSSNRLQRPPRSPHGDYYNQRRSWREGVAIQHFVAAVGEYVGTTLFLWFAFAWHQTVSDLSTEESGSGGVVAAVPQIEVVLYISIGYGFSLLVNAWAFYRVSGGLFNPAVVLGMILTGSLPVVRGIILIPAELLGGMTAAGLVSCMFPGPIGVTNTTLNANTSIARGLFIEMFLTSLLLLTILMLAAEKTKVTFMAPLGIGLALFIAELAGVNYTGGSLNPARTFGPAVASRTFVGYQWIYWLGPALGAVIAAGFYRFIKYFNYEQANPGQDSAGGDFVQDIEA